MVAYPQWWNATKTAQVTSRTDHSVAAGTTQAEANLYLFNDKGSLLGATTLTGYYIFIEASNDGGATWVRGGLPILDQRWVELSITGNVDNTGGAIGAQSTAYTALGRGLAQPLTDIPQGCGREIALRCVVPLGASDAGVLWRLVVDSQADATAYRCSLYKSGAQAIPNTTVTDVTFDSEAVDNGGLHSTAVNTHRVTIPAGGAGTYLVIAKTYYDANATGVRQNRIHKNGAEFSTLNPAAHVTAGQPTIVPQVLVLELVAGDYVSLAAYQSSGGALNIVGGANNGTTLSVTLLQKA
jgi:hypothetical protein